MTKYHSIYSLSVKDCQEMLMSGDYLLICKGKAPLIKARAEKAYSKFIEELQGLFGGEEQMIEALGKDSLIMSMKLRMETLTIIKDNLLRCYSVKDNVKGKLEAYDAVKALYRKVFFDYPKPVDCNADLETQQTQIDVVIKPIESEIKRLSYKIKELAPPKEDKPIERKKSSGLELHILFVQKVMDMQFFDRNMSLHSFSVIYKEAVDKNTKSKLKE